MNVELVIGANYGDEGKGLVTNCLAKEYSNSIVVCANGGSQRGHTVWVDENAKHVFHHFGSGTLAGRPTYFPKMFLLNPMQFVKEYGELQKLGSVPISFCDPGCYIQLPGDICLNWIIERARGNKRHGSVGCGIWESVYRIKYWRDLDRTSPGRAALTFKEFVALSYESKVKHIKDSAWTYAKWRLGEEHITANKDLYDLFLSDGFVKHFIQDAMFMSEACEELDFNCLGGKYETLIFENGQGLKLDQLYGGEDETNTTPSYTGSIAIANLLDSSDLKIDNVNLNYVSRTYLTKHGAGAFAEEDTSAPWFHDDTNDETEWQGAMRFGDLDYVALKNRINIDADWFGKLCRNYKNINKTLIMTHCNEIAPTSPIELDLDVRHSYNRQTIDLKD